MKLEVQILQDIVDYCEEIESDLEYFGDDVEAFVDNKRFQRSVEFCLFQIGEKVKSLRSKFGSRYMTDYWKKIAGMRDVIGHGYDSFDHESVWPIVKNGIPELRDICRGVIEDLDGND